MKRIITAGVLCLFGLSFSLLHVVYWCDMRMRAPLSPLLAVAASWGVCQLIAWCRGSVD